MPVKVGAQVPSQPGTEALDVVGAHACTGGASSSPPGRTRGPPGER